MLYSTCKYGYDPLFLLNQTEKKGKGKKRKKEGKKVEFTFRARSSKKFTAFVRDLSKFANSCFNFSTPNPSKVHEKQFLFSVLFIFRFVFSPIDSGEIRIGIFFRSGRNDVVSVLGLKSVDSVLKNTSAPEFLAP